MKQLSRRLRDGLLMAKSNLNSPDEARLHGDELYDEENYVDAMRWYRIAADQDDPAAQVYVAWLYVYALGVDQDLDQASAWLARAAEHGESDSIASMRAKIVRLRAGYDSPRPLIGAVGPGPTRGVEVDAPKAAERQSVMDAAARQAPPGGDASVDEAVCWLVAGRWGLTVREDGGGVEEGDEVRGVEVNPPKLQHLG